MKKINLSKLFLLIFVLAIIFTCTTILSSFKTDYLEIVKRESKTNNLDVNLVLSIIKTESKFNENAISSKGAVGLMQILPSTATWLAEKMDLKSFNMENLNNPEINIKLGCYYVRYLFDNFEDEELAICAYNAGEGVVRNWLNDKEYSLDGKKLDSIPYDETRNYLSKVKLNKQIYSFLYNY